MTDIQNRSATQSAAPIPASPQSIAEGLIATMAALLDIVERETGLVRAGSIVEAMALQEEKASLSQRYMLAVERLKSSETALAGTAPDLLAALRRHHETFRAMLAANLTVLATAHAVSEGIVRGVNGEMQRKNMPQTYTASGQHAGASARQHSPLAVSRSL